MRFITNGNPLHSSILFEVYSEGQTFAPIYTFLRTIVVLEIQNVKQCPPFIYKDY